MQPGVSSGSAASATVGLASPLPGSCTGGVTIVRAVSRPGTVISLMPTRLPTFDFGFHATFVTRTFSQAVDPGATANVCGAAVGATFRRTVPCWVLISTSEGGGPTAGFCRNDTVIALTGMAKANRAFSHWSSGPSHPADSHAVRLSPSNAEYGNRPGERPSAGAVMSDADDDAVIAAMPLYLATDV